MICSMLVHSIEGYGLLQFLIMDVSGVNSEEMKLADFLCPDTRMSGVSEVIYCYCFCCSAAAA
jgi:hypothetical protein